MKCRLSRTIPGFRAWRVWLLSAAFFVPALPLVAQEGLLKLQVRVVDSFTREMLGQAVVSVCGPDSSTVLCARMRPDSEYENGVCTSVRFCADVPFRTVYVLKVSLKGYEEQSVRVEVKKVRQAARTGEWNAPDIRLRKSLAADRTLGEATVKASRVAMVVKDDTIEYDARAFRLAEGSMLDNLMAMLPGMTVTEEGGIFVNGEYVSRLMVNGRNFFSGDPKVALDNLPAYTVSKIKAYHEEPEWEYLQSGTSRRTPRPMVVDVRLKREYAQGWMANAEAGGGSKTRGGWNPIYLGRFFGMRHTAHSSLRLYGSLNNLGDNQSPGRKGQWKKADVTRGERTVKVGGLNFDLDGRRTGAKYTGTFEARHEDIASRRQDTSAGYDGHLRKLTGNSYRGDIGQTDVKWNNWIRLKGRQAYVEFRPELRYMRSVRNDWRETRRQTAEAPGLPEEWTDGYTRTRTRSAAGEKWKVSSFMSGRIKSPLDGKLYEINGYVRYSRGRESDGTEDRLFLSPESGWQERRRDVAPEKEYLYDIGLNRELAGKGSYEINFHLDLSYQYRQKFDSGTRTRDTLGTVSGIFGAELPSARAAEVWAVDAANTYHTTQFSRLHDLGLYAVFSHRNLIHLQVRPGLVFCRRRLDDLRAGAGKSVHTKDVYPRFRVSAGSGKLGLEADYRYEYRLPDLLRMLDVRDASDPLYVSLGNPQLKATARHNAGLSWRLTRRRRQQAAYVYLQGERVVRAVGYERSYDTQTSVTVSRPCNIDGNWSMQGGADYSRALGRAERLALSVKTLCRHTHSIDFSASSGGGSLRNVTDGNRLEGELSLVYRTQNGFHVGAKGKAGCVWLRARPLAYSDNAAADYGYGLTFTAPVTERLSFEIDVMAYARSGYADRSLNTTDWVWNAALAYTLGRRKEWLVRAVGFDLLHQLSSVRREINEQGYTETRYNTVPSYATLHLVYRLHVAPRKR